MKKDIRNKEYAIQEVVAYYILGYRKYNEESEQKGFADLLKNILEIAKENIDTTEIKGVDINLLKRINFNWVLNSDDFVSYATCIFYVLMNREENITEEEKEIVRRGRNTQTHHIAKNASMQDYMYATAFEALIGYLYLTGQEKRLEKILNSIVEMKNIDLSK